MLRRHWQSRFDGAMDGCHGLPIQKVMRHLAVELELVAKNSRTAFAERE